jgi:hypothetical protein
VVVGVSKANTLIVAGFCTGGTKSALQGVRAYDRLASEHDHGDRQCQRSTRYRKRPARSLHVDILEDVRLEEEAGGKQSPVLGKRHGGEGD